MNYTNLRQSTPLLEKLVLLAIMALAFFMASIPHWDYSYPIHVDEWWHYGDAQNLIRNGGMPYPDPFYSGEPLYPDKEFGFHFFLGEVKLISDASWLNMFLFLPGIIFALLALQAYAFGKSRGFRLGAAFLITLIPTTARFLGPAFLVPVAIGLTFIPLTFYILHRLMTDFKGPILLFLIFISLLFIHPPTLALVSGVALVHFFLYLLPGAGRDRSQAIQSLVALIFLLSVYGIMYLWAPSDLDFILTEARDPEAHLAVPPIWDAIPKFGYLPVALSFIGMGILVHRGKRHNWAMVLSLIGLLAFEQIYPSFYLGPDIVYERGWLYTYVIMALLGGIALYEVWRWIKSMLSSRPVMSTAVSYTLVAFLVTSAFVFSLRSHLNEPYYHVVNDATYQDFLWVRDYVPSRYDMAVIDTGVAWAFGSVAQKTTYTAEVAPNFHPKGRATMQFLSQGANDTSWLEERGINIVYSPTAVESQDLVEVRNNVYLLTE